MAIEAKVKKRVVIPRVKLSPRQRKTKAQIRRAILRSCMQPMMSWEELRALTREP